MKLTVLCISVWMCCISCSRKTPIDQGEFDAELDGLSINYTVRGKGPVLIAGHLNSGKIGYELTLKPLEKKFTMVYYSPRGTGKSESPETLAGYQSDYLVKELELLRKHLKSDEIWIFGHSDQSEIALQYAIEYPNHVAGLILSGTHFISNKAAERKEKLDFENERKQEAWFLQVLRDMDYTYTYQTNKDSLGRDLTYASLSWWCYDAASTEKVIPIYEAISNAGRRKPINGQFPFVNPHEKKEQVNRSYLYQARYSEIKTKVLILQGTHDTNNPPKLVENLHQQIPNSTLVFIEKSGHFPWVEEPMESFDEIFRWLDQTKRD